MLELRGVNIFRGHSGAPVVENMNGVFEKGQVIAICGANGSGKSTLLQALAGEDNLHIESTFLKLFGFPHSSRGADEVAYLPQSQTFVAHDTVRAFLGFSNAQNIFSDFGFDIEELLDRRIGTLSLGQWKRVQLYLHFKRSCKLRLLDEPETALDTAALRILVRSIAQARQNSEIVFLVSHHFSFLKCVADQILILEKGKLVWCSQFNEFLKHGAHELLNPLAGLGQA